jgi:hypothetical protein
MRFPVAFDLVDTTLLWTGDHAAHMSGTLAALTVTPNPAFRDAHIDVHRDGSFTGIAGWVGKPTVGGRIIDTLDVRPYPLPLLAVRTGQRIDVGEVWSVEIDEDHNGYGDPVYVSGYVLANVRYSRWRNRWIVKTPTC